MHLNYSRPIALLVLFIVITLAVFPTFAQTPEPLKVGVVIKGQGGQISTYCVTLSPDKNTGLDALRATSLDLNLQAGPLGATVCRMQNLGCSYPAEPCFCQCQGTQCNYWAYYYQDESGKWVYSQIGALSHKLKHGDMEGWLWNEATNQTPAGTLPEITFASICEKSIATRIPITPVLRGDFAKTFSAYVVSTITPVLRGDFGYNRGGFSDIFGYIVLIVLAVVAGFFVVWRRTR